MIDGEIMGVNCESGCPGPKANDMPELNKEELRRIGTKIRWVARNPTSREGSQRRNDALVNPLYIE